jgi:hypothetical protein
MPSCSFWRLVAALAVAVAVAATRAAAAAAADRSLHRDFDAVWGRRNARFLEQGQVVELSLDERTGSRLESKDRYLFGRFDIDIRLVAGESAGTITSFYVSLFGSHRFILAWPTAFRFLFVHLVASDCSRLGVNTSRVRHFTKLKKCLLCATTHE